MPILTDVTDTASCFRLAASWILHAHSIVVTAGAGMSVDSGLPDFRGPEGFWRAYPPFRAHGLRFEDMSNPKWFKNDPATAWGFFGHRLQLYRQATPHHGYHVLRGWQTKYGAKKMFIYTSNVDGAFERVGFDASRQITECHGTLAKLQCTKWRCTAKFGPYDTPKDLAVPVDMETMKTTEEHFPRCPHCGALARPNVLMFWDEDCDMRVVEVQEAHFEAFKKEAAETNIKKSLSSSSLLPSVVIIEIGAGTSVSTIRCMSEKLVEEMGTRGEEKASTTGLIRINLREADIPAESVERDNTLGLSIACGAKEALERIDEEMQRLRADEEEKLMCAPSKSIE